MLSRSNRDISSSIAIIVLDTLRSSIRLRIVIDLVARLVVVEVVTSFLIRVVIGIT